MIFIDPFNYFRISTVFPDRAKELNAEKLNTLLYRTVSFKDAPSANILVGDSRTELLPLDDIERMSGKSFKKLTTNAAKLNEIIELVYFANEYQKLETVVIGINFNMFNEYGYADRLTGVKEIIASPMRYIFSSAVAEASYYVFRGELTGKNIEDIPPMTKEEFWKWNIDEKSTHWYGRYKFPTQLYKDVEGLDNFSFDNKINLIFIVVPHHVEFHDRLIQFGLANEEVKFKEWLRTLKARVIDYDYENTITTERKNFTDPVHYNAEVGKLIVKEIFENKMVIGKPLN